MKKIIFAPIKVIFYLFTIAIMYIGWIFVSKKGKEPDTSWEVGRKRIYDLGIEYWESELEKLNLREEGIDVLEVGSGNGQWLISFSKFANRVEGVEPGKEIIEYSKEKFKEYGVEDRIKVHQSFAEKLPQEDNAFDLVFCAGVFMFTEQKKALREFNRVLKNNGKVFVTVNGLGYFIMYLLNGMRYLSLNKTRYGLSGIFNTIFKWIFKKQIGTCAVSYNEIKKMIEKEGFELIDTRIWLAQELYPLEHFGFVTNYAFILKKI
ncbi:class I SAM-dependent methyltransferase [Halarcobacter sp.]|uniref:class I SAM-dependent methyltransferase n=1 Tax=Halarcobacter sp. TaxID=2321133 RepID=UPI003A930AD5